MPSPTRHPERVAHAPHNKEWMASKPIAHTNNRTLGLLAIHTIIFRVTHMHHAKQGARVRPAQVALARPTNEIHKVFHQN